MHSVPEVRIHLIASNKTSVVHFKSNVFNKLSTQQLYLHEVDVMAKKEAFALKVPVDDHPKCLNVTEDGDGHC